MNIEEYEEKLQKLKKEQRHKEYALMVDYLKSEQIADIGDIIDDDIGVTIIVSSVKYGSFWGKPECMYLGKILTKKQQPRKDGATASIVQNNVKRVNGEEI